MPTYDFRCSKCDRIIEIRCPVKERNKQVCECGGKLQQLFTSFPTTILGVGYYTRLSEIAPDKNASDEVKTKFKKMLKVRRRNPLNIRTGS